MTVYIRNDESIESAIKRFHRKVDKAGIIDEYKAKCAFKSKKEQERAEVWEKNKKRSKRQNKAS